MLNGWSQIIVTIIASAVISVGLSLGAVAYSYGRMAGVVGALENQVMDIKPLNIQLASLETKVDAIKEVLDKFIERMENRMKP